MLHAYTSAADWIRRQLRDTSASYYTLLAEAASRRDLNETKLNETFANLYPNLVPLR